MKLAFAFLALLSLGTHVLADLAGSKPNIILIMTDDQGYGQMACHGHPWLKTPNLDALHDKSLRFTRFLVSPTCSPTRSAIMTGRHPMKNGITHTILERERMTLDATILPQVLKTAGYTSAIFGKWHLGDEEPYQPHKRGFDEAFIHGAGGIGQAYPCSCADAPGNKYMDPVIRHNGSFVKTHGFCTDVFFTAALGWIKQQKDSGKPFFTYLATNAPHGPFIAPEKNAKRFTDLGFGKNEAGFYGMVENIDENMGRLAEKLKEWDLYKNTIIIFMSDNGTTGGVSGVAGKDIAPGYPFFNGDQVGLKGSTDEGGVRVPFFVRWDGHITPGRDIDNIAAHIDILPTLAGLANAEIPKNQVEGRSLLPLIENKADKWEDRFLYTHVARWSTGEEPNKYEFLNYGVRNQRFRYVGPRGGGNPKKNKKAGLQQPAANAKGALYDLEADPYQKTNVIGDYPEVADKMNAAYEAFWKETRPMMVNETAPMSPTQPFHVLYEKQLKEGGIPDWKAPEL
ncbi:arylsulfatase [Prosthecobacter sp.]|uniref:arylsulfatase n=1 Tax=Prosthecobacter sp. TaxID=1965333 RepID=UPI001D80CC26|nr:arylsulfatase [Prosthecobacter sp.]MCB1278468.1 arylsulfatase [Prosthecobacter sp.]